MEYEGEDNLEAMMFAKNYNDYLANIVFSKSNKNDQKILDIGAGIGTFAISLKEKGLLVDCYEPDKKMSKKIVAKKLMCTSKFNKLKDNYYDIVYSFNVLEHIKDDSDALKNWLFKLKPGGLMVLYLPAFNCLFSSMDKKVGHYRRYTKHGLKDKFNQLGVNVKHLDSYYIDSMGYFLSLIYKFIGNADGKIGVRQIKFYDKYIFPVSLFLDKFTKSLFGKNVVFIVKKIS